MRGSRNPQFRNFNKFLILLSSIGGEIYLPRFVREVMIIAENLKVANLLLFLFSSAGSASL